VLKAKRLERFGQVSILSNNGALNSEEAIKKRAERFKNDLVSGKGAEIMNERERMLIERRMGFGRKRGLRQAKGFKSQRKNAKIQRREGIWRENGNGNGFRGRRGGFRRGKGRGKRFNNNNNNDNDNGNENGNGNIKRQRRFRLGKQKQIVLLN